MKVEPAAALVGHIGVPGDKSISHRAVLIGAICDGETAITGFGRSADTESTIRAVRALGVDVDETDVDALVVHGAGLRGLTPPPEPIDCGNAGTLMRLLSGILAGQEGRFVLTGDESLRGRPMRRVADPLQMMGARVETTDGGSPLAIEGGELRPIRYELSVASAQVKSAVLLAGLYTRAGETAVVEPLPTRDHTENMLAEAGARIARRTRGEISVRPVERLELPEVEVPGDFSSAAPFLVAATLLAESELTVHGVNLNPRRTGLLDVLERMGANITVFNRRRIGGEPAGDLDVRHAELVATEIAPGEVPGLVDELPLFALAACFARGESVVRGAEELRAKESDRIAAVVEGLRALDARVRETPDGFRAKGVPARLRGGKLGSRGDHRIAMLGAVAGLVSRDGVEVGDAEAVGVSFPGFYDLLARVTQ